MCLYYILESPLEAIIGRQEIPHCKGYAWIPLPGPRALWNYDTSESWAHRMDRLRSEKLEEKVLTIGDLEKSKTGRVEVENVESRPMEMARWCKEIDEFGALVWMVSLLD